MSHHPNKIYTYYTHKQITSVTQLPVPFQQRSSTDIFCTIITSIFAIAMFVTACIVFNGQKLRHITYPTDNMGIKCTLDNPNFNYLYFTSINDPTKRLCVAQCPNGTEQVLKCFPNDNLSCAKNNDPKYQVQIYASQSQQTSVGLFCLPTDESARQKILQNSNLLQKFDFIKSLRSIYISAAIAFGLGVIFLLVNCCMSRAVVYISIALGGICFFVAAGVIISMNIQQYKYYSPIMYIISALFILFGIMLLSSLCFKRNDLNLCGEYLKKGTQILRVQKSLFLLIPIFIVLKIGLIALCWFQLLSFWSHSDLQFHPSQVYYNPQGSFAWLMQFLDLIQFLWGLCFLKQVFLDNFIISGSAVTYHFLKDSYITHGIKALFRFHWGSVVAGSFLLHFFFIPDLFYDFIKPSQKNKGCYKCFTTVCCACDRSFGFARSDTMAFINAVGQPFCNSSRWCERINFLSTYFDGSQQVFRYFSLGSHVLLAMLATVLGFMYSVGQKSSPHQLALIFSFLLNLSVVTYFICLLVNLCDSILLCDLVEKYLKGQEMNPEQDDSENPQDNRQPYPYKNIQQSNVNEGYQILPTRPK